MGGSQGGRAGEAGGCPSTSEDDVPAQEVGRGVGKDDVNALHELVDGFRPHKVLGQSRGRDLHEAV